MPCLRPSPWTGRLSPIRLRRRKRTGARLSRTSKRGHKPHSYCQLQGSKSDKPPLFHVASRAALYRPASLAQQSVNVRYGSLADIRAPVWDVRFPPKSVAAQLRDQCLLSAKNRRSSAFATWTLYLHCGSILVEARAIATAPRKRAGCVEQRTFSRGVTTPAWALRAHPITSRAPRPPRRPWRHRPCCRAERNRPNVRRDRWQVLLCPRSSQGRW